MGHYSSSALTSGRHICGTDLNGIMNILKNLVIFYQAKLTSLLIFGIYLAEIQFKFISRSINKHDKWEIIKQ